MPSRERNPCMWAAGALRGEPASMTATRRRARPRARAALRPAGAPPRGSRSEGGGSPTDDHDVIGGLFHGDLLGDERGTELYEGPLQRGRDIAALEGVGQHDDQVGIRSEVREVREGEVDGAGHGPGAAQGSEL